MSGWRRASPTSQQFPRRPARVSVRISTVDAETDPDSGAPFFRSTEATTANLSRGGAFVHSWEPLAAGRRVIVALDLPDGGELQLVGRVVWTRRRLGGGASGSLETPGYGIEFIERTRADQAALQQILDASAAAIAPVLASAPTSAAASALASASASASASPLTPASASTSSAAPVRPLTGPPV